MVALNLATGKVLWDRTLTQMAFAMQPSERSSLHRRLRRESVRWSRSNGALVWQSSACRNDERCPSTADTADHRREIPGGRGRRRRSSPYSLNALRAARRRSAAFRRPVRARPPQATAGTNAQVQGGEFFFHLRTRRSRRPEVTFVPENVGQLAHDVQDRSKGDAACPAREDGDRSTVTINKAGTVTPL